MFPLISVSSPSCPPGVLCFSELSFITEPSDMTVPPEEPAVLDCQAHGQPPVTIKWLKDGVRLVESEHVRFLPNGSLYIPKIKQTEEESAEGFYQCLSQNKYGAILSQRSRLTIARKCGGWNPSHSWFLIWDIKVFTAGGGGLGSVWQSRFVLSTSMQVHGFLT